MADSIQESPRRDDAPSSAPSWGQRLAALGLRFLVRLLSCTLLRVNHFFGSVAGRLLWWFDSEPKRVSRTNLMIAYPEMSDDEREILLKESLIELGKTVTELGPIWSWSDRRLKRLVTEIKGADVIAAAQDAGRGVIMLSPHFGAWELAGLHFSIDYKIVSLYKPPRLNAIEEFTRNVRERFGAQLVPTTVSGVRALCRSLKNNDMIGILPDQDPGESGGVRAPFFGYSARTMLLVSKLAARTNSALVFCVAERLSHGKGYRLHYVKGDAKIASTDELTAATMLNAGVESIIRINPAQYQWSYKRYKGHQPDPYQQPQRRAA